MVMWLSIADCRSDADRLETQEGSWLCQTRVWPRIRCPCDWAWETIWSPGPKLKFPRDGSVVSHFISFSGVIMLNSRSRIAVYAEVPSFPAGTAVPKYRPDCAAAAPSELAAAAWVANVAIPTSVIATPAAVAVDAAAIRLRRPPLSDQNIRVYSLCVGGQAPTGDGRLVLRSREHC
ncbi:hypothetical protein SBRY_100087 [Actinacidiphila bryophytorum]|uniref:Uncharacterized protein n=1 Tax=Actinacidiphila bryophytorum TaxID=1436133 RepID=A0A9W4E3R7_9ACTN|nr:hypothetical protein SBRY_100087 [Actinacidiphila bryophytorum]